ncbi:methyltransferase domain-containing protein [bacterium]|nr:MAG: methyltransferase domain-containing protein [bacterium]
MIEYRRDSPVIISGPSASGKSYTARKMENEYPVARVISVTTRMPRPGEVPNVDSIFMDDDTFNTGVDQGDIILPSGHLGAYYGYSNHQIEAISADDKVPLIEVYSPKIEKVLGHFATTRTVFLQPGDISTLEARMVQRGQDREDIQKRLSAIAEEMAFFDNGGRDYYNYIYKTQGDNVDGLHHTIMRDLGIGLEISNSSSMLSANEIASAYDLAGPEYERVREKWDSQTLIDDLCNRLQPGSRILDVGCGSGVPIAKGLTEKGMYVHGIDISEGQIQSAKAKNIEGATFEVRNMLDIDYRDEFDGIACFYSIYHLDRKNHGEVIAKLADSLKKGGVAMILFGVKARAGHSGKLAGADLAWSTHDMQTNLDLVSTAGLTIQDVFIDNAGDERHQVVIAKK